MTCQCCLCYEVCKNKWAYEMNLFGLDGRCYMEGMEEKCEFFKPKSRFVELPCEVGQKLYAEFISAPFGGKPTIIEYTVTEILFSSKRGVRPCVICCFGGKRFDNLDFGKTVFLSREEAEKDLKEREKE